MNSLVNQNKRSNDVVVPTNEGSSSNDEESLKITQKDFGRTKRSYVPVEIDKR